ncbi:MAG: GTPase HflX [Clostridiales bacterium]|nr:GTPase HflX [Clostridiales bacterium]
MEATSNEIKKERVLLAGVHTGCRDILSDTTEESMAELAELAKTAGAEVVTSVVQNKAELESATYMGEGKLEEIKNLLDELEIDTVIFDDELSPVQLRNLSDIFGIKVIDRTILILDIFAMRAKSGEGKLQVELAQLKYRLPRLRGLGVQMSRTGGGIGTRGPGETKLESDRRHINRRISALEEEIKELQKHRELLRSRRRKDGVITACLVGYTNAGKSSLLNRLTDAEVLAENKLFATLDTTSRGLVLEDNRKILLVDTVGFIRKLPHHLVEAFKSTLEETVVADFLLHVIDSSNPQYDNHIRVVDKVLADLGAGDKPIIGVYNKADLCTEDVVFNNSYAAGVSISVKTGQGLERLMELIGEIAPGKKQKVSVLVPYSEGSLVNELHENQKILSEEYTEEGTKITLLADRQAYEKLKNYII